VSYEICIRDKNSAEIVRLKKKHHMRGATYPAGGEEYAALNVTYNYSALFDIALGHGGLRQFYGKRAGDCIAAFKEAADKLDPFGVGTHEDYWEPTGGNAAAVLLDLAELCNLAPNGIFDGD